MIELSHTLAINSANHPALTLSQIWNGLILRITEQTRFTLGLDSVDITDKNHDESPTVYRRVLHFGAHQVRDSVFVVPQQSIEFVTEETPTAPSGRLLIQVNDDLSLTFSYTTQFPDPTTPEEEQLLGIIKAAYQAADADMIRIIREQALSVRH